MQTEAESDVCARCAAVSGTCCTLEPGSEEYCFPVSASERAAMELAGAKAWHFHRQANTIAFLENLCRLFPDTPEAVHALFPVGGFHDRVAITQEGACALLGSQGCTLPRQARPLYCRIYPFWFKAGRQLYFEFHRCQAQLEAGGGAGLLRRLGMTNEGVRHTYQELCRAWNLPESM